LAYIGNKPANKAVVASDLDPAVITGQTALAVAPADTDEFLISDAGTLKRIDASLVGGGGITQADIFRLTANITSNADITSNLERADDASSGLIGSGVSQSSGIFTFPETGIYLVIVQAHFFYNNQADNNGDLYSHATINNSDYDVIAVATSGNGNQSGAISNVSYSQALVDVTNTSNVKVKFSTSSLQGTVNGNTDYNMTSFSFIRLGDT
jgi:hypothetical protein